MEADLATRLQISGWIIFIAMEQKRNCKTVDLKDGECMIVTGKSCHFPCYFINRKSLTLFFVVKFNEETR